MKISSILCNIIYKIIHSINKNEPYDIELLRKQKEEFQIHKKLIDDYIESLDTNRIDIHWTMRKIFSSIRDIIDETSKYTLTDITILEMSKTEYKQRIITEKKEKLNHFCNIVSYYDSYFDVFSIPIEIIQYYYFWGYEMKYYSIYNFCKRECINQSSEYRKYLGEFKPEILRILKELGFKHMEGLERKYL